MSDNRRRLILIAVLTVALTAFVTSCQIGQRTRQQSALQITFRRFGPPGGAFPSPPPGLERFDAEVQVTNVSKSPVHVRYGDGQLVLADGSGKPVGGGPDTGVSSTAMTAGHQLIYPSGDVLEPGSIVLVTGSYLLRPEQTHLTLTYKLDGYPDQSWSVR